MCLTLVHGSMLSLSSKQKSNTKSSSKAGLAGVDNTMSFVVSMKHFFVSQVRSINITVGYFYITDRLLTGEISRVIYKPTEEIKSVYLTKALQGNMRKGLIQQWRRRAYVAN